MIASPSHLTARLKARVAVTDFHHDCAVPAAQIPQQAEPEHQLFSAAAETPQRRRFEGGNLTRNAAIWLDGRPMVASGPDGAFPLAFRASFIWLTGASALLALLNVQKRREVCF